MVIIPAISGIVYPDVYHGTIKKCILDDMNESVTTRQASEVLGVHESSIKRWCNSSELPFWSTPGGHRRIRIADLVSFANARGLDSALATFDSYADAVWSGAEAARRGDFSELVSLMYVWIDNGEIGHSKRLLQYLRQIGFNLAEVFDNLVGPVMNIVGDKYGTEDISVGDEHRMTHAMRSTLLGVERSMERPHGAGVDFPTAIVGCGPNEMHELGALMTCLILEDEGWHVVYVGANLPSEDYAVLQQRYLAELVCISLMNPLPLPAAVSITRTLAALASGDSSYRLAFGGRDLKDDHEFPSGDSIREARTFASMQTFVAWVRDQTLS